MILLGIAFLAGVITALSPCVLPVLPILLAGGASGRRPYGIILGLVGSFSVFTVIGASLLDSLGLPFDPGCLAFHENRRAVRTASSEQVRRPINREGVGQWRPYERWLGPLKEALGPVLDAYPEAPG